MGKEWGEDSLTFHQHVMGDQPAEVYEPKMVGLVAFPKYPVNNTKELSIGRIGNSLCGCFQK